ncbi:MAG TPA: GAF domain-containing protein [Coleofasciculaceae cyanobacterium]
MNSNYPSACHVSPQETANLRQPQLIHSASKTYQPEEAQSIHYKNQTEAEWQRWLYDSLPCICFTLNSTGVILAVSQFAATYLGYETAELTQKLVDDVFYGENQASFQIKLTDLQQQATQMSRWEAYLVCKNGNLVGGGAFARLIPGTESNPIISLVCEGITAPKHIEETQREPEKLHQGTFGNISEPVFIKQAEDNSLSVTKHTHNDAAHGLDKDLRFAKINECFLSFGSDPVANINSLTALCGQLLGATCALYNRLNQGMLYSVGQWHTPSDYNPVDSPDGHICWDAIQRANNEPLVVSDLSNTPYAQTDPNVRLYQLKTYMGQAVKCQDVYVGALCAVYQQEFVPSEDDKRLLGIIASAISVEEERKQAEDKLALRHREFLTLHRLSEIHLSNQSLKATLQEIVEEISAATGFPMVAIERYDEPRQMMVFEGIKGIPLPPNVDVLEVPADQTLSGTVARTGQPVIKSYAPQEAKNCDSNETLSQLGIKTFICMPMLVNDRVIGALSLAHPEAVQLDDHLPQWAASLANYVASLTERKQAEKAMQQQLLRERLVSAIAQRIHDSLDLEKILDTTVTEVRQFLDCDRVVIFRLHSDGSGIVVVESVGSDWTPMSGTIINDRYFAQLYLKLYQQGRVQAVEDIYAAGLTQCHVDLLAKFQARANLVVPIVQEENLWGLLVAQQCRDTRKWQPLEIDLLKSLSTQAAIAIHQSELYQQAQSEIIQRQQAEAILQQQFQRERLIGSIAQRIRQSLNLEKILNATVDEVRQVLQTDRVILFRFEPDWSGNVVVESVDSSWPAILGTNIYDPCFEADYVWPYQQGRVKAIEDIYTEELHPCHLDLLARLKVRANLVVPVLNGEKLWGLLVAHHCSDSRHWQQFEIDLLTSLASQLAIAIQQSQLYEQAQAHAKRERAINQVTQVIHSSLDLDTVFSKTVCEIAEVLQVDRTQIVQYLPERKIWLNVSEYRKDPDLPVALGLEIPDENNPIADRLKRFEVVRIDDADTCEDETNKGFAQTFPGAWLLVPLHFGSKLWGSLGLVKTTHPYHWQESEVELICAVADQVAIAIHQAELYEQSRSATATALTQAQQLEQALQELQKTQTQLVQSEKMSSLGQLVAGVAHEINNPVSFIYGNLVHAGGYTQDLLGLLQLYQQQYPNPTSEIQSEIEAIDLDFLIEDLPKLLDSMRVGAERICEIVRSLRNFSRLAEAEMKAVDIHEGLDSTLVILQNRLKAQGEHPEIQVIKEYGNLPRVECYAGQLNQVFMNLLTNAIDALEESVVTGQQSGFSEKTTDNGQRTTDKRPIIRIRTELLDDQQIAIRIADNGPGMTAQVQAKLFDPFFTTKPVGIGTGLGLSISYQIVVEKHGGQLNCLSELGQGTEFLIQIPLLQAEQEPGANV